MDNTAIYPIEDDFVTLDIETTGLDYHFHSILEIAYAVGDEPIETIHFPWWFVDWGNADPKALTVNRWFEREAAAIESGVAASSHLQWFSLHRPGWEHVPGIKKNDGSGKGLFSLFSWFAELGTYADTEHNENAKFYAQMNKFLEDTVGKTLVGAALAFDVKFIEEFMFSAKRQSLLRGEFLPSHRLWDVQMYAAGKYGWPQAKSLQKTIEAVDPSYEYITRTDHTAAGDVRATRRLFRVLTGRA